MPQAKHRKSAEMIVRQEEPLNLETPLERADTYLTPTELFYVRSHFETPRLDPAAYQLAIDGAVGNPLSFTVQDLKNMPSVKHVATLECAGNGRAFLAPRVRGVQWELGAVGNAEWTGVSLASLLDRACLQDDVCEIVLEGADRGTPSDLPRDSEPIAFARSISRAKAIRGDVLVAYEMNGQELPLEHGYPVRAIVPGHYGMASVKWLTHIEAVRAPFQGYWQTSDYAYWDRTNGRAVRQALGSMELKSEIVRPRAAEVLGPNERYRVMGLAWSGETAVTQVCVSTDGGQTWSAATLLDPARAYAWRRWAFDWLTPRTPGRYSLLSRAAAADGNIQPDQRDPKFGSYVINHLVPIDIVIEGAAGHPRREED